MANTRPVLMENGRVNGALGLNTALLKKLEVKFRMRLMEDFDLILQVLTKGHRVLTYSKIVYEQVGSNTAGGCSIFRTKELQEEAAKELHKAFPEFVKLVEKKTKHSWQGQSRLDVVVQWKKAYESFFTGSKNGNQSA
jgi:hypothetical protein